MHKPILVTGSHLSGTTWIGKIIATAPGIRYIHEPFNVGIRRYQYKSPLQYWFEYLSPNTDKAYQQQVIAYLKTFYGLHPATLTGDFLRIRSVKKIGSYFLDLKDRITASRPLFKDPIAVLSSAWIADNLGADVIVSVRHPAAFVASLKVKKWDFDFNNFLGQTELLNDYAGSYRETIKTYTAGHAEVIDQGILLWNIIYGVAKSFVLQHNGNWQVIKNEDLSQHPIEGFEKMFGQLKLPFTEKVKQQILETTGGSAYSKVSRDSRMNISTWKERLTDAEIGKIKEGTREVWSYFYTESEWS